VKAFFNNVQGVLQRGLRSKTVENTFWLGGSSAVNGAIGAVVAGVLARFLGVAEYGIYTLIISFLALVTDIADLGFSSSIVRFGSESVAEGNRQKLKTVVAIVMRWKLIVGAVILSLALIFLNTLAGYIFNHVDEQITAYLRLSLVGCALSVGAGLFTPIYHSFKQFRTYALLLSLRSVTRLVLILAAVYLLGRYSVELLIWVEISAISLFFLSMYIFSPFKELSFTLQDRDLERKMFSFNKWISLYQAITLLGARLDMAFIGGLSDANALGLYGAASKISGLIGLVSSSYMSVLLADMSASLSQEVLSRKRRNSFLMVGIICSGILCILLMADPLVAILFGAQFAGSVSVLRILCAGLVFNVLSYPLTASLFSLNKSSVFPVMSSASLAALITGNIVLVPLFAAEGAAMAYAISMCISFIIAAFYFGIYRKSTVSEITPGKYRE
jgi:O-antigen/teichoic acid export membrane protein